MKESNLVSSIRKYLRSINGIKVIKIHGSSYTEIGTPDLIGCYQGRMFLIEVKMPGNHPTPIQIHRMKQWENAGAIVFVANDLKEVENKIK